MIPETQVIKFCDPPIGVRGQDVEFRLVYRGPLPAARWEEDTRRKEKHAIRKELHKQLAVLWQENHVLSQWTTNITTIEENGVTKQFTDARRLADRYERFGYRWLPLINERIGIAAALDILFLRRDAPGKILQSGGDIDNRIKVLFDAMRMPKDAPEIKGFSPEPGEDPFFVLLEDDTLINEVRVSTDRLLIPQESGEAVNDVVLVIHVKTIVTNSQKAYIEFYT